MGTDKNIFTCGTCKAVLHLKCGPSYYTEKDLDRMRRPDSLLTYTCNSCRTAKRKPDPPANMNMSLSASLDSELQEFMSHNQKLKDELADLSAKLSAQNEKIDEQDAIIAELRRFNGNDTFNPDVSGITLPTPPDDTNVILNELKKLTQSISSLSNRIGIIEATGGKPVAEHIRPTVDLGIRDFRSKSPVRSSTNKPTEIKQSFAEILAQAPVSASSIRHVHINADDGNCDTLLTQIQKDNSLAKEKIIRVQHKGPCDFSVTCLNEDAASKLESALNNKYREGITISTPKQTTPQVKITRLMTDVNHEDEILEQLREQNAWLTPLNISAERAYRVTSGDMSYVNLIVNADIASQRKLLEVGFIIFGVKQSKIFECVDVKQCRRCQGLGHLQRTCQNEYRCRRCAGAHETSACLSDEIDCINCILFNTKNTTKVNTGHRASDDRCPCKQAKIKQIKRAFVAKNAKNQEQINQTSATPPKNAPRYKTIDIATGEIIVS